MYDNLLATTFGEKEPVIVIILYLVDESYMDAMPTFECKPIQADTEYM